MDKTDSTTNHFDVEERSVVDTLDIERGHPDSEADAGAPSPAVKTRSRRRKTTASAKPAGHARRGTTVKKKTRGPSRKKAPQHPEEPLPHAAPTPADGYREPVHQTAVDTRGTTGPDGSPLTHTARFIKRHTGMIGAVILSFLAGIGFHALFSPARAPATPRSPSPPPQISKVAPASPGQPQYPASSAYQPPPRISEPYRTGAYPDPYTYGPPAYPAQPMREAPPDQALTGRRQNDGSWAPAATQPAHGYPQPAHGYPQPARGIREPQQIFGQPHGNGDGARIKRPW